MSFLNSAAFSTVHVGSSSSPHRFFGQALADHRGTPKPRGRIHRSWAQDWPGQDRCILGVRRNHAQTPWPPLRKLPRERAMRSRLTRSSCKATVHGETGQVNAAPLAEFASECPPRKPGLRTASCQQRGLGRWARIEIDSACHIHFSESLPAAYALSDHAAPHNSPLTRTPSFLTAAGSR